MMKSKRIFSILLTFFILASSVSTVSAADQSDTWLNVLDYCTADGVGGNRISFKSSGSLVYELPFGFQGNYVDIVLYSIGTLSDVNVYYGKNDSEIKAKVINMGQGVYRVISTEKSGFSVSRFRIEFLSSSTSTVYVAVHSFRLAGANINSFPITGQVSVDYWFNNSTGFVSMPDVDTKAELFWGGSGTEDDVKPYHAWLYPNSWKEFDYIDFSFYIRAQSIESLSVTHNGEFVPFEMSYLDTISQTWVDVNNSSLEYAYTDLNEVYVTIRIDVSNLDKTSSSLPRIGISGQFRLNNANNRFVLYDVVGHVASEPVNPIVYWLQKIFGALIGDTGAADEFGSIMESQAGELEDIGDALDDVTKPDIDDLDGSLDDVVSPDQVDAVGSVFASVFQNSIILHMLLMALTLALVSYVLYGKR